MCRSFKVGFNLNNVPKVILFAGPKFHFNTSNGTGAIKRIVHRGEKSSPTPTLYNKGRGQSY